MFLTDKGRWTLVVIAMLVTVIASIGLDYF